MVVVVVCGGTSRKVHVREGGGDREEYKGLLPVSWTSRKITCWRRANRWAWVLNPMHAATASSW